MSVHTIWVPKGMSVEQVWEHIKNMQPMPGPNEGGRWVNVDENGKVLK